MAEIKILHSPCEREPFVIAYKPSGLPSAPLKNDDDCALNRVCRIFPEILSVKGKKSIEYGLIHRIDNETKGLLLIAANQFFYDSLILQQKEGKFKKNYFAETDYFPELKVSEEIEFYDCEEGKKVTVTSRFRTVGEKGRMVKPVFCDSSFYDRKKCGQKNYTTEIILKDGRAFCTITEGFRHQVRTHLACIGHPVKGDSLYNPKNKNQPLEFEACGLEFINPVTDKIFRCNLEK